MSQRSAPLDSILECLRAEQSDARERYGIRFVGVVGSFARGEQRADSDVDVLMEVVGRTTYFRLGELEATLTNRLGRPVDLVDRNTLKPVLRTEMERDLVPV